MKSERTQSTERPLGPAIRHGLAGHCPACGEGRLFARFLEASKLCAASVAQRSMVIRQTIFPAYIVILLLGHIISTDDDPR